MNRKGEPMTKQPFISSVRVENSRVENSKGLDGPHEYVTVFIRGQNVGTLVVGAGDGLRLQELLARGMSEAEASER
jgi:hypothetical protein